MVDKKRFLITGANGLLGRHTIVRLRECYDVHAVVRSMPHSPVSGIKYHIIDFSENWLVQNLPESVDTVIHLAQSAHFREFPEKALDVFRVNVDSTARLLDYAHRIGVKCFIYASSGGVYGSGSVAFDENSPIVPPGQLGYYLGSKLCGEVLVQNYAPLMNVIVMRFFFMYGPGQKPFMLIPRLIDNIKAGQAITIQGNQGIHINPIHVSDATRAMTKALTLEQSATFNIAGPEVLSLQQIGQIMGNRLNIKPKFEIKPGEAQDLIGDTTAMREQLCIPQVRIADGIQDLL